MRIAEHFILPLRDTLWKSLWTFHRRECSNAPWSRASTLPRCMLWKKSSSSPWSRSSMRQAVEEIVERVP